MGTSGSGKTTFAQHLRYHYGSMASIVASTEPRIRDVKITSDTLVAYLLVGRVISVPLAWSWRLSEATPAQRAYFRLIGDGKGVHWPDVDEDISVEGMLHGVPAHRPQRLVHFGVVKSQGNRKTPKKGWSEHEKRAAHAER